MASARNTPLIEKYNIINVSVFILLLVSTRANEKTIYTLRALSEDYWSWLNMEEVNSPLKYRHKSDVTAQFIWQRTKQTHLICGLFTLPSYLRNQEELWEVEWWCSPDCNYKQFKRDHSNKVIIIELRHHNKIIVILWTLESMAIWRPFRNKP